MADVLHNILVDSPHFWALALYKSKEYGEVGVPMMPNVKGKPRTMLEMKIYSVALMVVSLYALLPMAILLTTTHRFTY